MRFILITSCLCLLTGCFTGKTIYRDYPYAYGDECDCYQKHPFLTFGIRSDYVVKVKGICTRFDYPDRRDSVTVLEQVSLEIWESDEYSEEEKEEKMDTVQSIIDSVSADWTHQKVRTKFRYIGSSDSTEIVWQKVKLYNRFLTFGKKVDQFEIEPEKSDSKPK